MSGHSKWANIKNKKGLADAKRSKVFSKMANAIAVAARSGGDPDMNPSLRDVIAKARASDMPRDNIDRAIKRGTGETPGVALEEFLLELFGPNGMAVLVRIITDNKNRTLGDIRSVLNTYDGRLAETGSVQWMFDEQVRFEVPRALWETKNSPELEAIDAGAEDISGDEGSMWLVTTREHGEKLRSFLEKAGFAPQVHLEYAPKNALVASGEQREKAERFLNVLYDLDDVESIYPNTEFA
jgi:YebC/PmpR family DNA-binding regulatory protein